MWVGFNARNTLLVTALCQCHDVVRVIAPAMSSPEFLPPPRSVTVSFHISCVTVVTDAMMSESLPPQCHHLSHCLVPSCHSVIPYQLYDCSDRCNDECNSWSLLTLFMVLIVYIAPVNHGPNSQTILGQSYDNICEIGPWWWESNL